jgi:hypothetical protein
VDDEHVWQLFQALPLHHIVPALALIAEVVRNDFALDEVLQ